MLDDLYNTDILTMASALRRETLESPCGHARSVSKLCGSELEIDIDMEDGLVTACALRVQACVLGQASAAILKSNIIGASRQEIKQARDALWDILKHDGDAPSGRFESLAVLKLVASYPARHQSVMLAFDGALDAVNMCGR